jgi:riboflavin synthase
MFTGIVQAMGRITEVAKGPSAARLVVEPGTLPVDDVTVGDSIAVGGCCLTVVAVDGPAGARRLAFDVSAETLACTAGLDRPGPVNLEKALRLSDRLGGHLMTGHVDGVGTVVSLTPVESEGWDKGSRRLEVEAPQGLARYVAPKGSIAVQGVSLTVNGVDGARFHVNLIPHTLDVTTLSGLVPGAKVNLEIDLIARYVARMSEYDAAAAGTAQRQ